MITPEQYFEQHPDVAVLAWGNGTNINEAIDYDDQIGAGGHNPTDIDWTGYDRRIAFNPHFQWGKRREIEWLKEYHAPIEHYSKGHFLCRELIDPDGNPTGIAQFGRYVDAPDVRDERRKHLDAIADAPAEKPAPELSQFLPEGWEWVRYQGLWEPQHIAAGVGMPVGQKHLWKCRGLLHPSEGGGFQKMKSLTELMEDVDILWEDGSITFGNLSKRIPKGWRPHFKKGGES